MVVKKLFLSLAIAVGMIAVLLPQVDGIMVTFGDSSFAFGTPLDDNGDRTVCSDGFELIAASTPNGGGAVGTPTDLADGEIVTSPAAGVYDVTLLDFPDRNLLSAFTTATGFDLRDPDGALISNYGQTTVDMVGSSTFFDLPPSDPVVTKTARAIGSTMFVPTSPLPVGQDVVIVTSDFPGLGGVRQVTVVDCSTAPPLEVDAESWNYRVRPQWPNQRMRIAIFNDGSFDPYTVTDIEIGGAAPFREWVWDFDWDGDRDILAVVRTGNTTVECGDTTVTVTGLVDGEPFETVVPIVTKCWK